MATFLLPELDEPELPEPPHTVRPRPSAAKRLPATNERLVILTGPFFLPFSNVLPDVPSETNKKYPYQCAAIFPGGYAPNFNDAKAKAEACNFIVVKGEAHM